MDPARRHVAFLSAIAGAVLGLLHGLGVLSAQVGQALALAALLLILLYIGLVWDSPERQASRSHPK